eukprot:tig00001472_g8886.t1
MLRAAFRASRPVRAVARLPESYTIAASKDEVLEIHRQLKKTGLPTIEWTKYASLFNSPEAKAEIFKLKAICDQITEEHNKLPDDVPDPDWDKMLKMTKDTAFVEEQKKKWADHVAKMPLTFKTPEEWQNLYAQYQELLKKKEQNDKVLAAAAEQAAKDIEAIENMPPLDELRFDEILELNPWMKAIIDRELKEHDYG